MTQPLPDIRDLTDDPQRDRDAGTILSRIGVTILYVVSVLALLASAQFTWSARDDASFASWVVAVWAAACVAVPLLLVVPVVRSGHRDLLPLLAFVAPIVVWISTIIFLVIGGASLT